MSDAEARFLGVLAAAIPGARGYRAPEARAGTDERIRGHIASEIERMRGRIGEIKSAADAEGEEDMVEELDRIDLRMAGTIELLRVDRHAGLPFFTLAHAPDSLLERVCVSDRELLEDLALLARDVMSLKYDTIGTLTLREAEGTLAAIELRIANRGSIFDAGGED